MRVLYCSQHFSTPQGSVGQRSYEMARRLIERGHQVTMICGRYKGGVTGLDAPFEKGVRRGVIDGIDVIEFDLVYSNHDHFIKRSVTFMKFVCRSIQCVFTIKYDVIFSTSTPLTAGIPGIIARCLKQKPFVFEVRDLWPELPKAMGVIKNPVVLFLLSSLESISYRAANQLIGLSPGMVDGIVRRGIHPEKVHLISNGCDFHVFDAVLPAARPLDIKASDLLAIYTGTHGIANGLDAVVDAAIVLKKRQRTHIKLVCVGQGKLKSALQQRVQQEALGDILYFLEPMPKEQLARFMACADLGMQILANVPAFYNGTSPNKFFDYIAAGLPVLINYPGWLGEKIQKNECGFMVPPDDAEAFATALEEAARDRDQLLAMGQRAKQLAEREFNRQNLSHQWVDVIESVSL